MHPDSYGYFIDEFYYISCSKKLAFGYVDHPPFSIFILFLWTKMFGTSVFSLHSLAALFGALSVYFTGRITARLGGKIYSQLLACATIISMPAFFSASSFYSMNIIEMFLCIIFFNILVKLIKEKKTKLWVPLGIMAGIGFENKHTFIIYIISVLIGLLIAKERKLISNKWALFGLLSAIILILPNLIWQYANSYPSLTFYKAASSGSKEYKIPFYETFTYLAIFYNPAALPVWLMGIIYLFFRKNGSELKFIAWAFLFLIILLLVSKTSRPDRIAGIFPILTASGSVYNDGRIPENIGGKYARQKQK